jgi:hypothetical protein
MGAEGARKRGTSGPGWRVCMRVVSATFGVLGPVEVHSPGGSWVVLPPPVRALAARLALSAGRVVSVDALTDALWGEDLLRMPECTADPGGLFISPRNGISEHRRVA